MTIFANHMVLGCFQHKNVHVCNLTMTGKVKMLASFQTQVRVKFYNLTECGTWGVLVKFARKPDNCRDKNSVEVRAAGFDGG